MRNGIGKDETMLKTKFETHLAEFFTWKGNARIFSREVIEVQSKLIIK